MSADTRPISPSRFASALKELSLPMLHLKVLEIRNSIAHLQYSNDQLRPFAEGTAVASPSSTTSPSVEAAAPDQDCVDAIAENLTVIDRMAERIALVRAEVEERGLSWTEFQSAQEAKLPADPGTEVTVDETSTANGATQQGAEDRPSPWTDGTFQTGTIRNGEVHMDAVAGQRERPAESNAELTQSNGSGQQQQGGSLSDEQLRRAMEERMRNLGAGDEEDEGMHL
ncbi:hypothetical protein LIA77_10791 [Sarocladium implicatum]|nr:hypothetical protein LIA77_10791 [Sarocladium implicatum]